MAVYHAFDEVLPMSTDLEVWRGEANEASSAMAGISRRGFLKGAGVAALTYSVARAIPAFGDGPPQRKTFAYVGTYTKDAGNGKGIYLFEMNPQSGALSRLKLAAETPSPSWLCLHPSGEYLYAANEVSDFDGASGSVSAFAVNRSNGDLRFLNVMSSAGAGPAHLSVDASGKFVFVANYGGGSIAVLPIRANGSLAAATDLHRDTGSVGKQQSANAAPGSFAFSGHDAPHAHMIRADPANRFVVQTDLGQDRIYVYDFDHAAGKLRAAKLPYVSLPSGDGPRHFAFHPNGRWLYSIQEEASTIVLFFYDSASGALTPQQTISTLPPNFAGSNFTSEVLVSADGRFLYAGNRLHDTVAVFSIGSGGPLNYLGETSTLGDYPSQFQIDPSGMFLYACNHRSDNITSFRIDRQTGLLASTGQYTPVGSPGCIVFLA
jgi:6-phosphogluconolactonase